MKKKNIKYYWTFCFIGMWVLTWVTRDYEKPPWFTLPAIISLLISFMFGLFSWFEGED